jgi:hypothetical protein
MTIDNAQAKIKSRIAYWEYCLEMCEYKKNAISNDWVRVCENFTLAINFMTDGTMRIDMQFNTDEYKNLPNYYRYSEVSADSVFEIENRAENIYQILKDL